MKSIGFHIQKGGVGKTTLSVCVADAAARRGFKTLLIDGDHQGNTSSWLLHESPKYELADVLRGNAPVEDAIVAARENLDILATFGLGGELNNYGMTQAGDEPFIFDDLMIELRKLDYDLVVVDMHPSMGHLERAVLLGLDEVITPLLAEDFSVDGLEIFKNEIATLEKRFRKPIRHNRIVVNAINKSIGVHVDLAKAIAALPYEVHQIGQDARIKTAQRDKKTLAELDTHSRILPEIDALALAIVR